MTASTAKGSDPVNLQDDIAALKRDVSNLIQHLKTGATNGAEYATTPVDDVAHRLYRDLAVKADRSAKILGTQIAEQPFIAPLVVIAVGYVGGRILSR